MNKNLTTEIKLRTITKNKYYLVLLNFVIPKQYTQIGITDTKRNYQRDQRSSYRKLAPINELGHKYSRILSTKESVLRFGRSKIAGLGLFTMEPLNENEMLIEYCGEKIRTSVAELREQTIYKTESGEFQSSYFFKLDDNYVIDSTLVTNQARFINHCCDVIFFIFQIEKSA